MSKNILKTITTVGALALLCTGLLAAPQSKSKKKAKPDAVTKHIDAEIKKARVDKTDAKWKTYLPMPELATFDAAMQYVWVLETTEGTIEVVLMPDVAPRHVTCTMFLTRLGFYDDLTFHRVISGFMAQGGCPLGNGTGAPGFKYDGEFSPSVRHDRPGLLSMANAGPGTDGSQFFLTFVPTPHLNDKHTIFGEILSDASMKAVKQLESNGSRSGATSKPMSITKATIRVEPKPVVAVVELPHTADEDDKALGEIAAFTKKQKINKKRGNWKQRLTQPPLLTFTKGKSYFWNMDTNQGTIKIKLLSDVAPMHVSSTIYLARLGFYDDLTFHRVIRGFMAQGGCPVGRGNGSPGYSYAGEFDPSVRHNKPGLLSMANSGPNTDGSQFFLTFVPTPHLDGKHTIFGEVVEGMDTVKKLESMSAGDQQGTTKGPVLLRRSTISVE